VWLPGEKEAEVAKRRLAAGIPVGPAVRADIEHLAARLGVGIEALFPTTAG
jgi:LDH2 family malate/lactate/ureidoglycolate dehydrogenase